MYIYTHECTLYSPTMLIVSTVILIMYILRVYVSTLVCSEQMLIALSWLNGSITMIRYDDNRLRSTSSPTKRIPFMVVLEPAVVLRRVM